MTRLLFLSIVLLAFGCKPSPEGQKVNTSDPVAVQNTSSAEAESFKITTGQLNWTASKVGGQHLGTVEMLGGEISIKGNEVLSGHFEVDMNSIANIDLDEEGQGKLVGHLKSPDFFNVEEFPEARFEVTSTSPAEGQAMATHNVTGNLTIKGISKSVSIPVNISFVGDKLLVATPAFTIDRTEWDIKYRSGLIGTAADKVIHDEVSLVVTFEAEK